MERHGTSREIKKVKSTYSTLSKNYKPCSETVPIGQETIKQSPWEVCPVALKKLLKWMFCLLFWHRLEEILSPSFILYLFLNRSTPGDASVSRTTVSLPLALHCTAVLTCLVYFVHNFSHLKSFCIPAIMFVTVKKMMNFYLVHIF
jgi:hypothetical protein